MIVCRRFSWCVPIALAGSVCLLVFPIAGCGPGGPPRYEVSGKAMYGDQPIPAGQIVFEPDREAGNSGPLGLAMIEDGRYKTLPDDGASGGPQMVRILGYDGDPPPAWPGSPFGQPIFPPYQTKTDLPRETTTVDFEVPAE